MTHTGRRDMHSIFVIWQSQKLNSSQPPLLERMGFSWIVLAYRITHTNATFQVLKKWPIRCIRSLKKHVNTCLELKAFLGQAGPCASEEYFTFGARAVSTLLYALLTCLKLFHIIISNLHNYTSIRNNCKQNMCA